MATTEPQRVTRARIFYALPLPAEVVAQLQTLQLELQNQPEATRWPARFTRPEQLHVTIKFVGNVARAELSAFAEIVPALAATRAPIVTSALALTGFPNARRASVIVTELVDRAGEFAALASALDRETTRLGIEPETRKFRPHVTLARLGTARNICDAARRVGISDQTFALDELRLYESRLSSAGSTYSTLVSVKLGG